MKKPMSAKLKYNRYKLKYKKSSNPCQEIETDHYQLSDIGPASFANINHIPIYSCKGIVNTNRYSKKYCSLVWVVDMLVILDQYHCTSADTIQHCRLQSDCVPKPMCLLGIHFRNNNTKKLGITTNQNLLNSHQ